jgi:hypothetical protein
MAFDNETKPFDTSRVVPFARIRSPRFNDTVRADGRGLDCGCRDRDNYDPSFLAASIAGGLVDAAGKAVPVPPGLENAANRVLKEANAKTIEEFKQEVKDWIAKHAEGALFAGALRLCPSWVPVNRKLVITIADGKKKKSFPEGFKEVAQEVQGRLTRSFQSVLDPPVLPWSRFYGWNFQVRLDPGGGFEHVIGRGNVINDDEVVALGSDIGSGDMDPAFDVPVTSRDPQNTSFECIWDAGAISQTPGNQGNMNFRAGVMFHEKWPFWPMAGDRFWAEGRWVYDCTHPGPVDTGADGTETELHWTMLNPCRAIATYRYEGFKFDEEPKAIPASRFLFFASVKGGYKDAARFTTRSADADPIFLVDLPPPPVPETIRWTIGHSPEFELNTVVVRPRLRLKIQFIPFDFGIPSSDFARDLLSFGKHQPKIEVVRSRPDTRLPDQLMITIPLSTVSEDAYGVVVSAGWADPTGDQAARTRKVTVKFDQMTDVKTPGAPLIVFNRQDIVRVKLCANGHWGFSAGQVLRERVGLGVELPPFFLPDDADLVLSAHGTERRGRGQFMEENPDKERQLHVGGIFGFGSDELERRLAQGEKVIKIATDTGEVLTLDIKELKILQEGLGAAKELLKKRRTVVWDKEAATAAGRSDGGDVDQPDDSIASAVARETYMKPVSMFNKHNGALALADHQVGAFTTGTVLEPTGPGNAAPSYQGHKMSDLLKTHRPGVKTTHTFKILAPITEVVGDCHLLGFHRFHLPAPPEERHYTLHVTVTIEDQ